MSRRASHTVLAAVATVLAARALGAQATSESLALRFAPPSLDPQPFSRAPLYADGRYVVVHVAENRLYVLQDGQPIWSAPVATGSGFRLERAGRRWHFVTPRGVFRIQRKEKNPVWIKPDWAFIEEGRPVPPLDSPLRREEGMLGTTALYIGYQLAIHGTNRPGLVLKPDPDERRVSHGCIRMTNEDARTLYHLVDVGTPVLIY